MLKIKLTPQFSTLSSQNNLPPSQNFPQPTEETTPQHNRRILNNLYHYVKTRCAVNWDYVEAEVFDENDMEDFEITDDNDVSAIRFFQGDDLILRVSAHETRWNYFVVERYLIHHIDTINNVSIKEEWPEARLYIELCTELQAATPLTINTRFMNWLWLKLEQNDVQETKNWNIRCIGVKNRKLFLVFRTYTQSYTITCSSRQQFYFRETVKNNQGVLQSKRKIKWLKLKNFAFGN